MTVSAVTSPTATSYSETLLAIALARPDVIVMTADNRAPIRGLSTALGDRLVDVGICEQTMVGAAAGLALRGRTPVVHALASFLSMRAFEFVRTDIGVAHLPVKLIGYVPGLLSDANGPTHQALEDVALMRGIPHMQVFCPADAEELSAALPALIESRSPCYVRYNAVPAAVTHATPFVPGKAEVLSRAAESGGVALLTYGFLLREVDRARIILQAQGVPVELINVRSLKPLDEDAVIEAAQRVRLLVAVEDHFQTGGLYSILAEVVARHGLTCRLRSISLAERWFRPALLADVLEHEGFTGPQIAQRVRAELRRKRRAGGASIAATTSRYPMNGVRCAQSYPEIARSDDYYRRALDLIPAVTQTLAKGPGQHVRGVAPKYLARGKGSHVWDVDGNEYIDYQMGIGPISLGYAYDRVDEAIRAQLADGITFSLMHPLEVEVAELVRAVVPGAERVRFSKTGCDVTSAAVRLARAYTGRDRVVCCGYHGWHDWYVSVTPRNAGIPAAVQGLTSTFDYNDLASLASALDSSVACVILEPVTFEAPREGFLAELGRLCSANGTLLIFDEMWTGFRLALGGAQEYFGVRADLACFSKAIANGMPLSVLAGRKEIMGLCDRDVFFFTTFGGETLSLAAAKATIHEMQERGVQQQLASRGRRLRDGYNALASRLGLDFTRCIGYECRSLVSFDARAGDPLEMKSLVQQELVKRGVLWGGFHNLCYSHSEADIDHTLAAYAEVLPLLAEAVAAKAVRGALRGEPVEPVFRRSTGFNVKPAIASAPGIATAAAPR